MQNVSSGLQKKKFIPTKAREIEGARDDRYLEIMAFITKCSPGLHVRIRSSLKNACMGTQKYGIVQFQIMTSSSTQFSEFLFSGVVVKGRV